MHNDAKRLTLRQLQGVYVFFHSLEKYIQKQREKRWTFFKGHSKSRSVDWIQKVPRGKKH